MRSARAASATGAPAGTRTDPSAAPVDPAPAGRWPPAAPTSASTCAAVAERPTPSASALAVATGVADAWRPRARSPRLRRSPTDGVSRGFAGSDRSVAGASRHAAPIRASGLRRRSGPLRRVTPATVSACGAGGGDGGARGCPAVARRPAVARGAGGCPGVDGREAARPAGGAGGRTPCNRSGGTRGRPSDSPRSSRRWCHCSRRAIRSRRRGRIRRPAETR
jgi:hypothetical protein